MKAFIPNRAICTSNKFENMDSFSNIKNIIDRKMDADCPVVKSTEMSIRIIIVA